MKIRAAQPHDLLALERIENDADALFIERFRPETWWPAPSGQERATAPGFILVAIEEREVVVGFVHVVEAGGVAHLEQLSVAPVRSRQGFGRALVDAAKGEASRRGHEELTLRTYESVPWNAPFYARAGFRPSEPATEFHLRLLDAEASLGLDRFGPRIQMTAPLPRVSAGGNRLLHPSRRRR